MSVELEKITASILDSEFNDSLENLVAQLGTEQDKRSHSKFVNRKRLSARGNEQELSDMYRTDWVSGKVVDILPDDMTREWREFIGDIDPEVVQKLVEEENRIDLVGKFNLAHKWARLYGTSFIVMSVDDGQSPEQPLNIDKIRPGGLRHLTVIDRNQINTSEITPITNPLDPNFGFPEYYRFNESSIVIHHTRMIRFDGVKLPYDQFKKNDYCSDSVLDRLYDSITNFNTATNAAASMIYESNVDVLKIKGLMNYLSTPEGTDRIRKRIRLAGSVKSINNALILDTEEEHNVKQNNFSGVSPLIDQYGKFLSSGSDIPAVRFLGTQAQGLNATGEGDLKNYYDNIKSKQTSVYKPKLDVIDKVLVRSLGLDPADDYAYRFKPLFQMSPVEIADVQLKESQRDATYLDRGIVTEAIVAKELRQKSTYTNITDEYIDELESFENENNAGADYSEFEFKPTNAEEETTEVDGTEDPEEL